MSKKIAAPQGSHEEKKPRHYILPAKRDTVVAETLARLLAGEGISQLDATRDMSTTRLSGIIFELRRMGWGIVTKDETAPTKDGRRATYARYYLPQSAWPESAVIEAYRRDVFTARARRRAAV